MSMEMEEESMNLWIKKGRRCRKNDFIFTRGATTPLREISIWK